MSKKSLYYRVAIKFAFFLLMSFVSASCAANDPLVDALGKEPRVLPQACPARYGEFDWLGNITLKDVSITKLVGSPSLGALLKFTTSGEERWYYPKSAEALDCSKAGYFHGSCIENWPVVEECLRNQLDPLGTLSSASSPDDPAVPFVPSSGTQGSTTGGSVQSSDQQSITLPQVFEFYWQKPSGEMVLYPSESDARSAVENSWEGGSVAMVTKLGDLKIGEPVLLGNPIASFTPPPGVSIASPNSTYYGTESGLFFTTLEEAVAYSLSSNSATNIHSYVRGVDLGLAQSVAEFTPVSAKNTLGDLVEINADQSYLQVTTSMPDGTLQLSHFTTDNLEGALKWAYQLPYGSDISEYKRGVVISSIRTIGPWSPSPKLVQAFNGSFNDLSQTYWVFKETMSSEDSYLKTKEEAISFGESYGMNCIFPGGMIIPYIRDIPQEGGTTVGSWTCPPGLPLEHKALDPYQSRVDAQGNEMFFPSLDSAIRSSWQKWFLGLHREYIYTWVRGVKSAEAPATNWWATWQWLLIGALLIFGAYLELRKPLNPDLVMAVNGSRKKTQRALGVVMTWMWRAFALFLALYGLFYVATTYGKLVAAVSLIALSLLFSFFYFSVGIVHKSKQR